MTDLQSMNVNSVLEPMDASPEFNLYDNFAKAYNKNISGNQKSNQLIQETTQVISQNPELIMAL